MSNTENAKLNEVDNLNSYNLLKKFYENYYESRVRKENEFMKTVEKRLADPDLAKFDNTIDYNKMLSIIYMFENVKDVFILDDNKIIGIKEPSSTNGGSRRKTRRKKQTRKQTKRKKQTRKYMF